MQITWLGHSGFRFDIGGQVLLVDPWLNGNPMFPAAREAEAIAGTAAIFVTHGHGDHFGDVVRLAQTTQATVYAPFELGEALEQTAGIKAIGFAPGGTVSVGAVRVSMVPAIHSSSVDADPGNPKLAGSPCGYMIAGEGHMIYVSGDTSIMADMGWIAEYYQPDIGILCAGGHYTMDMEAAAWAARRFFQFKTVIPCHYKTFGVLAQSADVLVASLPGVDVRVPGVMEPMVWQARVKTHVTR